MMSTWKTSTYINRVIRDGEINLFSTLNETDKNERSNRVTDRIMYRVSVQEL